MSRTLFLKFCSGLLQNHIYDRQVKRMDADKMKMQEKLDEADVHDTQLNNSIQDQERQLSKLESKVSRRPP